MKRKQFTNKINNKDTKDKTKLYFSDFLKITEKETNKVLLKKRDS